MSADTRSSARVTPSLRRRAIELVAVLVVAALVSVGLRAFVVRSFFIPSESMQATLEIGDRILVDMLSPHFRGYDRGDVVVFRDPGGWLAGQPTGGGDDLVKRIIGLPGEHVTCCDIEGRLVVDGKPLDEPYVSLPPGVKRVSADDFDVVVPAGEYWVMGDNRYRSADSRYHRGGAYDGFVPRDFIVGRAFVTIWPLGRAGFIG